MIFKNVLRIRSFMLTVVIILVVIMQLKALTKKLKKFKGRKTKKMKVLMGNFEELYDLKSDFKIKIELYKFINKIRDDSKQFKKRIDKTKNINIDDIENYELNTDYYRAIIIHKFIDTRDKGVGLKKDINFKEMFIERLSRLKKYIDDNKKELELR